MKVALTIAGSDSGGGAGIQADLKAMQANGVFGATVLTAITAQNTKAITAAYDLPLDLIEAQIDAVFADFKVAATKTGMLSSVGVIELVSRKVREYGILPLVVDPVMVSKSGYSLLQDEAMDVLVEHLIPLATVITPNAHEAARLAGMPVETLEDARVAARKLYALGSKAVLVKGGHLEGETQAVDVLFDGDAFAEYRAARLDSQHTHGTGCTFAASIAANLAKGYGLRDAIDRAKRYVTKAIQHGLAIGSGHGPTHHFYFLENSGLFPFADMPEHPPSVQASLQS